VNKGELVGALASKMGISKAEAARLLDGLLDTVKEILVEGGEVRLVGFGTFKAVKYPARKVRNPQNGKEMTLAPGYRPRFTPGKPLKVAVNKRR
jgi:DNA-binding protein HU-beta